LIWLCKHSNEPFDFTKGKEFLPAERLGFSTTTRHHALGSYLVTVSVIFLNYLLITIPCVS